MLDAYAVNDPSTLAVCCGGDPLDLPPALHHP
jgi:hypothetical protein